LNCNLDRDNWKPKILCLIHLSEHLLLLIKLTIKEVSAESKVKAIAIQPETHNLVLGLNLNLGRKGEVVRDFKAALVVNLNQ